MSIDCTNFNDLLPDDEEVILEDSKNSQSVAQALAKSSLQTNERLVSDQFNNEYKNWIWNGVEISSMPVNDKKKVYSFVYRITNNITGKFYIGYKGFYSKSTKVVNHKKRHIEKESDWQNYWSSGELLHADIAYYGRGNFTREILALCPNKAIGKFCELCFQIKYKVCTENANNTFNNILNVRLSGNALKRYTEIIYADGVDPI